MKEMYMDDVGKIATEATELIISRLKEFGIDLESKTISEGNEDIFFNPIWNELEIFCKNGYKNHM